MRVSRRASRGGEEGFALILALLALLLLTFLGLTLAVTTSTELQIASNYRWSEQARTIAEAGVEAGKIVLREAPAWDTILPPARTARWDGTAAPAAPGTPRTGSAGFVLRDFENAECDVKGNGMGKGLILTSAGEDLQYISQFRGLALNGAFTLWVRRPLLVEPNGDYTDWGQEIPGSTPHIDASSDNLILVAEGTAPFRSAADLSAAAGGIGAHVARAKAVYTIEVALSRTPPVPNNCQTSRTGQAGHGSGNTGFAGCEPLAADAMGAALQDSTGTGSGAHLAGVR